VGRDYYSSPSLLFDSWKRFAVAANFPVGTQKELKDRLENAGFTQGNSRAKGGRFHDGIKVNLPNINVFGKDL